ncbi:FAD-dependent oxidoreductase [Stappia stellulata]|uniref:FAD-dependent oxidoreductase n=1 Tax=Stappia stellulata TaxID=71235 RepID=UPI00146BEE26|nr:FAD-dependent monooxygenase [Stappia stellulata]
MHSGTRQTDMANRVIVAGAGPVGLAAAVALADRGVPVLVLEKRGRLTAASKASTFHPSTLEILDALGVIAPVLAAGQRIDRIQYRTDAAGIIAEYDLGLLANETRYPFRLHLEQSRVTPLLLDRLAEHDHAEIRFGAEVVDAVNEDGGVTAVVAGPAGSETVRGLYLIAADGARSAIRDRLGIAFDGSAYSTKVLRLMTDMDLEAWLPGLAPVTYVFNGEKSISLLRMPDCWRIIIRLPVSVPDEEALKPEWMLARLREVLPMAERLPPLINTDIYSASKRVAARYRDGGVFLAGDSVHVTNTRGGMNMNCGLHDAWYLAGAMAEAIQTGDLNALDAYAEERHRIATDFLIPRTDRSVGDATTWLETVRMRAADPEATRAFLVEGAMLDIAPRPFGAGATSREAMQ